MLADTQVFRLTWTKHSQSSPGNRSARPFLLVART